MIKSVTPNELHEMLKAGKVKFQYKKKDGSTREAIGTLNPTIIEDACATPNGGRNFAKEAGYSIYFDVEKDAFRCFAETALIGVVEG